MYDCLITFRSVLPAQRAEDLLQKANIRCMIRRTPKWMERQGCGYSLRLSCGYMVQAAALLEENHIAYRKLYRQRDGKLEEVAL